MVWVCWTQQETLGRGPPHSRVQPRQQHPEAIMPCTSMQPPALGGGNGSRSAIVSVTPSIAGSSIRRGLGTSVRPLRPADTHGSRVARPGRLRLMADVIAAPCAAAQPAGVLAASPAVRPLPGRHAGRCASLGGGAGRHAGLVAPACRLRRRVPRHQAGGGLPAWGWSCTSPVMIGEIGGDAEERAGALIEQRVTKPVVGYVAGFTAPEGKTMGHAGAIISGGSGTAQAKKEALEKAVCASAGRRARRRTSSATSCASASPPGAPPAVGRRSSPRSVL